MWGFLALLITGGVLISAASFFVAWRCFLASRPTHIRIIRGQDGTRFPWTTGDPLAEGTQRPTNPSKDYELISWSLTEHHSSDIRSWVILYGPAGVDGVFGLREITQVDCGTYT